MKRMTYLIHILAIMFTIALNGLQFASGLHSGSFIKLPPTDYRIELAERNITSIPESLEVHIKAKFVTIFSPMKVAVYNFYLLMFVFVTSPAIWDSPRLFMQQPLASNN